MGQGVFFFVVAPFCSCPASLVSRKFFAVGPGCAKCFFFCAPLGAATFRRGQSKKKKHHPGCFFFLLRPRGKAGEGEAPLGAGTGPEQKKKHHPGCFFFFLLRPRPDRGGVFFFCCGPARTLTHSRRFRQGPGGVFFFAAARRVFLDNNKKCLGYYIGSKKTRRGHSKKKNTTSRKVEGFPSGLDAILVPGRCSCSRSFLDNGMVHV